MTTTPIEAPPPAADASVADADAAIKRAEQEATDALRLAETLAEQVRNGEDVEPDQLASAEQLGRFARLRVTAAKRKADKVREAERQRQLTALRDEIEGHRLPNGAHLAELLQAAETALDEFLIGVRQRNDQIGTWLRQAEQLGVPQEGHAVVGDHQGIKRRGNHTVIIGNGVANQVTTFEGYRFVSSVLHRLAAAHRVNAGPGVFIAPASNRDPYDELKSGGA